MTGIFGACRFDEVAAGESCVINVTARQYKFGQSSQVIGITVKYRDPVKKTFFCLMARIAGQTVIDAAALTRAPV